MKPPSALARITGTPFVALVLFGVYAAVLLGCSQGHIPVWMAAIAVMFAVATGNSVIEVSHYKRWMARWEAMGGSEEDVQARLNRTPWLSMLMAAALLVFLPTLHTANDETVTMAYVIVWLLSALYLVVALCKVLFRRRRRSSDNSGRQVEEQASPTEYLVGRASSSPSLHDATRNLPDYAAAMLRNRRDENF
ncbi:hypothetical protein [Granulicella aggregans]|uniref:hypothetical protein n=1 Tax=Granulicella aggregans TaxID=474949 RepID=UPI0021DFF66A|nr:hypothetical protein [Granulicella aggregans]